MRKPRGQVALALNIVIAIFVVGSLGMVSYEMSRILLAREQLKHCLELASLAGGVSMASTSQTGTAAQQQAQTVAMNILQMNSVLGQPLTNNVIIASSPTTLAPSPGQTAVYFEFDDPVTKKPPTAGNSGNVLRVYGAYAYPLFSGGFGSIGVSTYTLVADAMAGMPALDLTIVYNTTGSLDDQTNITMIRRHWDQVTNNNIIYSIPGRGPGTPSEGPISGAVCPPVIGSQVNGLPPQNLDAAGNPVTSTCSKEFSEVGPNGKTVPLRGITNLSGPGDAPPGGPPSGGVGTAGLTSGPGYGGGQAGTKYGNTTMLPKTLPGQGYQPWWHSTMGAVAEAIVPPAYAHYTNDSIIDYETANPYGADTTLFTDVVVNLDGNVHFGGYVDPSNPGYAFPSVDYLVESARGNMENGGTAPTAWISNTLANASQPGYQAVYTLNAYKNLQPKSVVESALANFCTKVTQTSDCHFSFVAFSDRAGTGPADTMTAPTVSWAYPVAGNTNYALPHIGLDPNASNLQALMRWLTPPQSTSVMPAALMVPNGGCNLADGLTQAYNDLTGPNARTGAMKAIVVVTDKVPTRDLAGNPYPDPTNNAQALSDAMTVANNCSTQGIPIFMVTIDQSNGQMTPYLQAQYSDTSSSGLIKTAGHGGALYIINWPSGQPSPSSAASATLNGTFNNVLRQLTTLVQG